MRVDLWPGITVDYRRVDAGRVVIELDGLDIAVGAPELEIAAAGIVGALREWCGSEDLHLPRRTVSGAARIKELAAVVEQAISVVKRDRPELIAGMVASWDAREAELRRLEDGL